MSSQKEQDSSLRSYYHYTNQKGAEGIEKTKKIKETMDNGRDAVFGAGVYLTGMSPRNNPKEIIRNNYDDGQGVVNDPTLAGKVKYVAEVQLHRNEVEKVASERDVYLYKGDLDLNHHKHKIRKCPNTKSRFAYN